MKKSERINNRSILKINKAEDVPEKEKLLLAKIAEAISEAGIADKEDLIKATILKFEFTSTVTDTKQVDRSMETELEKDRQIFELEKENWRLKRELEEAKNEGAARLFER